MAVADTKGVPTAAEEVGAEGKGDLFALCVIRWLISLFAVENGFVDDFG